MMSIPLFYFPMKLLFVDDDTNILNTYKKLSVPNKIITADKPISITTDPLVEIINEISTSLEMIGNSSNLVLNKSLNFHKIDEMMLSEDKYDILGSVVSDYQMPDMNGIEYLKSIKAKVNKILLTGVFTSEEANDAYANNLIDYYIRKDSQLEKVKTAIKMVEIRFFIRLSQSIIQPDRLIDNNFIEVFNRVCGEAKEYWIINEYCGFKFIDSDGKVKIFNIYNKNDLDILGEMLNYKFGEYTLPNPLNMQEITNNVNQINGYYYNILEV